MTKFLRKKLRLQDYDYSQNGAYFITICTKNREESLCRIVAADDGGAAVPSAIEVRLTEYGHVVERYLSGIPEMDKFVIMPNHIHMILRLEERPMEGSKGAPSSATTRSVPQIVRSFKYWVTRTMGETLFQRSYHDHIIRDQQDYEMIWTYVDTNPLKWEQDCFYTA